MPRSPKASSSKVDCTDGGVGSRTAPRLKRKLAKALALTSVLFQWSCRESNQAHKTA
jgi:hypothetical protein